MTPQSGGALDLPVLIAMMLVALLLRSSLGAPRMAFGMFPVAPPETWRTRPGIVLGLILGLGGLLLLMTVWSPR